MRVLTSLRLSAARGKGSRSFPDCPSGMVTTTYIPRRSTAEISAPFTCTHVKNKKRIVAVSFQLKDVRKLCSCTRNYRLQLVSSQTAPFNSTVTCRCSQPEHQQTQTKHEFYSKFMVTGNSGPVCVSDTSSCEWSSKRIGCAVHHLYPADACPRN